jgi:hypothetical protein
LIKIRSLRVVRQTNNHGPSNHPRDEYNSTALQSPTKSTLYCRRCSSARFMRWDVSAASPQPVVWRVRSPATLALLPRNNGCHATTMALALQQRSFSFCTLCAPPFLMETYTHAHRVPFELSKQRSQPRYAVFCSDATTIITIECHAAQQHNNQQSLSQRQPSQRRCQRRRRQPSQQQPCAAPTTLAFKSHAARQRPFCSTGLLDSSTLAGFCYCAHIAFAIALMSFATINQICLDDTLSYGQPTAFVSRQPYAKPTWPSQIAFIMRPNVARLRPIRFFKQPMVQRIVQCDLKTSCSINSYSFNINTKQK